MPTILSAIWTRRWQRPPAETCQTVTCSGWRSASLLSEGVTPLALAADGGGLILRSTETPTLQQGVAGVACQACAGKAGKAKAILIWGNIGIFLTRDELASEVESQSVSLKTSRKARFAPGPEGGAPRSAQGFSRVRSCSLLKRCHHFAPACGAGSGANRIAGNPGSTIQCGELWIQVARVCWQSPDRARTAPRALNAKNDR